MIENTLVLSTAHMRAETNTLLQEMAPTDFEKDLHDDEERMPFRFVAHHYGWIIFLSDSAKEPEFTTRVLAKAADLAIVIQYTVLMKCTMINFDRDGSTTFDLPTYKW